jgi:alanyl-tRNA synthetase
MLITSSEIKKKYIEFFLKKKHKEVISASVIPDKNDETVLFTTAGMQQFVPNLMGKDHEKGNRLISIQKCIRTVDISEVGDNRHLTFFEMLGNWSLGDYFKEDAIQWSYEFLLNELKIPKEKLWITIYGGDETIKEDKEAKNFWIKNGIDENKIISIGASKDPEKRAKKGRGDNFWGPAGSTGPCGPSTEIFVWLGKEEPSENQTPATDEDNFVEIWNNVFMEFFMDDKKEISHLSQKNVDTGMGIERLTMVLQNKKTVFETDIFSNIIKKIEKLSNKKYPPYQEDFSEENEITRSFRVISDHIRCITHLIADGVSPSNEKRGYVLRRLVRRSIRFGKKLGLKNFLQDIIKVYITDYSKFYKEIEERKNVVLSTIELEEEQFLKTLDRGEKKFLEILKKEKHFSGKNAFTLSDTYGFPKELTLEILKENDITINKEKFDSEFNIELKNQINLARNNAKFERKETENEKFNNLPKTIFIGDTKENTECEAKILDFSIDEKNIYRIVLDKTVFYAEGGGQVGDRGGIFIGENTIHIFDTQKNNNIFIHYGKVKNSSICIHKGDIVKAKINIDLRKRVTCHHSGAHLLQSALIEVLNEKIEQAGSLVDENRTRFDFSFPRALYKEEIEKIEKKIIEYVNKQEEIRIEEMDIEDAKDKGAVALFSEKYGKEVRTVKMGDTSFELCGGTHISNTSEIGAVKIISESSVSSGIRRIEMFLGLKAQEYFLEQNNILENLSKKLKTPIFQLENRINKIMENQKLLTEDLKKLNNQILDFESEEFFIRKKNINNKSIICEAVPTHDMKKVAGMSNILSKKNIDIVVLFTENGGIAIATKKNKIDAREVFKNIQSLSGGKGGGSPFFVQGKGMNLEEFQKIKEIVESFT